MSLSFMRHFHTISTLSAINPASFFTLYKHFGQRAMFHKRPNIFQNFFKSERKNDRAHESAPAKWAEREDITHLKLFRITVQRRAVLSLFAYIQLRCRCSWRCIGRVELCWLGNWPIPHWRKTWVDRRWRNAAWVDPLRTWQRQWKCAANCILNKIRKLPTCYATFLLSCWMQ